MEQEQIQLNFEMPADLMDAFRRYTQKRGFKTITEAFRDHIRTEAEKVLLDKTDQEAARDGQV